MKILFCLAVGIIFFSCNSGFGSKLTNKKLDVYFESENLQPYADSLGNYWSQNKLTGDRKQSIKLTKRHGVFEVRIIRSEEFNNQQQLTTKEIQLLMQLKDDLKLQVFENKPTELLICDDEFEVLTKI